MQSRSHILKKKLISLYLIVLYSLFILYFYEVKIIGSTKWKDK